MKTGQMLFVAAGGMMLGIAGTLAVQTGLMHYEVTLDIRPRGPATLPPPSLSDHVGDPYITPPVVQNWEPAPPVELPPLDDQQIAEIVTLRERIGHSVSQKLNDLTGSPADTGNESFTQHLRAAAGKGNPSNSQPDATDIPLDQCPAEAAAGNAAAHPLRDSQRR